MTSTPHKVFRQFPAALPFAMLIGPEQTLAALELRTEALRNALKALEAELAHHSPVLPRVALLETEYQRAVTAAELAWVNRVSDDLQTGTLTWSEENFAGIDSAYLVGDENTSTLQSTKGEVGRRAP